MRITEGRKVARYGPDRWVTENAGEIGDGELARSVTSGREIGDRTFVRPVKACCETGDELLVEGAVASRDIGDRQPAKVTGDVRDTLSVSDVLVPHPST